MIDDAEAVFFDIGGVVLDLGSVREGHRRFVAELAKQYDLDEERALQTWRAVLGEHFRERRGTEFRSAAAGYDRAIEAAVGAPVPEAEWRPVFEKATGECLRPVDGVRETLEALSEEIYLGLISDIDTREAERILGGFSLLEYFNGMTTSEAVGRTKPDPAVFATAIGSAGVSPGRSVMIGDRYHNDMHGGSWAGLRTVAFGGSAATGPEAETDGADGDAESGGTDSTGSENGRTSARDPDGVVDYRVADLRDLLEIVGLDGGS
ncbi:HAD family hydrolase [Halobacteriales archaeon QS_3_64_16]|nr:MAG: HAD family hydrolase [Halobacteriales archaeon QS_3_64_16]